FGLVLGFLRRMHRPTLPSEPPRLASPASTLERPMGRAAPGRQATRSSGPSASRDRDSLQPSIRPLSAAENETPQLLEFVFVGLPSRPSLSLGQARSGCQTCQDASHQTADALQ